MRLLRMAAVVGLSLVYSSSFAHVSLGEPAALAGTTYKAALRVGHGCAGSPTTAIKVLIPAGFKGAKPMPKPGWMLTVTKAPLARPYDDHGRTVTEDVAEIVWTAASKDNWLPDAYFDEFVFRGGLPAVAGPMWFKVVQSCETGSNQWVQIPADGQSPHSLASPAALLDVIGSGAGAHAH
jgi:periplasmic copper chaperone A